MSELIYPACAQYKMLCSVLAVTLDEKEQKFDSVIFESNLTNICDVFLWWQAECRQVLCVALSNARRLLSLSTNQTAGGEIKIDAARSTLNTKVLSGALKTVSIRNSPVKSCVNLTLNHLNPGD